ncbi:MAG: peptide chain release factor N(5)-glutamine methyltransferase [Eubacterium sp.]|jgi:release factor glutamine methyltransferase|nr:peptide chain release factor N(5)-glutamine methyltransferase [Eubacterium sp.]
MDIKRSIIDMGAEYLERRGIENARQESGWLFEHVFGKTDPLFASDGEQLEQTARLVSVKNTKRYNELLERRVYGEPLQYLLGEWEFYGLRMNVGEGVLIPRPETEFLVELGIDYIKSTDIKEPLVIDLCAGTGCVAIAMAKIAGCRAVALELSERAIDYANKNIKLNNVPDKVRVYKGDIFDEGLVSKMPMLDCIFANPPYLSKKDMQSLQKEVTREPTLALYGGEDGLDFYRKIFKMWRSKLKPGGLFAVEVGDGQAGMVSGFMSEAGMEPDSMKDYSGIDRVVYTKYSCTKDYEAELRSLLQEKELLLLEAERREKTHNPPVQKTTINGKSAKKPEKKKGLFSFFKNFKKK